MPSTVSAAVACAEVLDGLAAQVDGARLAAAELVDVGDVHRARCAAAAVEVLEAAAAEVAGRLARLENRLLTP